VDLKYEEVFQGLFRSQLGDRSLYNLIKEAPRMQRTVP
jgi:hypothetical protein